MKWRRVGCMLFLGCDRPKAVRSSTLAILLAVTPQLSLIVAAVIAQVGFLI